jgi:hypothetical protein
MLLASTQMTIVVRFQPMGYHGTFHANEKYNSQCFSIIRLYKIKAA